MSRSDTYTIKDLSALTDTPRRTVRFYIQQGLVDRPEGSTRGAHYTSRHLDQLIEIRKWQKAGLSLERIRELLETPTDGTGPVPPLRRRPGEVVVRSHVHILPGIELVIDPNEAGMSPEELRALVRRVRAMLEPG